MGSRQEIAKLRGLSPSERPNEVVFVVSTTVEAKTRDRAKAAWGEPESCTFWSGTELDERVKRRPRAGPPPAADLRVRRGCLPFW